MVHRLVTLAGGGRWRARGGWKGCAEDNCRFYIPKSVCYGGFNALNVCTVLVGWLVNSTCSYYTLYRVGDENVERWLEC